MVPAQEQGRWLARHDISLAPAALLPPESKPQQQRTCCTHARARTHKHTRAKATSSLPLLSLAALSPHSCRTSISVVQQTSMSVVQQASMSVVQQASMSVVQQASTAVVQQTSTAVVPTGQHVSSKPDQHSGSTTAQHSSSTTGQHSGSTTGQPMIRTCACQDVLRVCKPCCPALLELLRHPLTHLVLQHPKTPQV